VQTIKSDPATEKRRDLATARFQLRIAEATVNAKHEGHPGNRAAAAAHAIQLRAYITEREQAD
jgi:hypothetical protein